MESINRMKVEVKRFVLLFLRVVIAGCLAFLLYFLFSKLLPLPTAYQSAAAVIIAVPLALYLTYGWVKGFKQLKRPDYLMCLAGGLGVLIAEIIIHFF